MFILSISEVQSNSIMTYDAIIKGIETQLQCKSELEDKRQFLLFRDIAYHWTINESSSSYAVLVNREDGHATWDPVSAMRCN